MLLPELVTFAAAHGIGTAATNLFYGLLPSSPDACVALFEYGGLPNEPNPNGDTRLEFPRVQAIARGVEDDYDGPRLKLQQLVAAFMLIGSGRVSNVLSGVTYRSVDPIQPPFYLHRDENFRPIFAVNFQVMKEFSST